MIDNQKLAMALRSFAAERDWDQFHTPKNLATSISVEAAELLELFQWSRGQKGWDEVADPSIRTKIEEELADILLYLIIPMRTMTAVHQPAQFAGRAHRS